MLPEEQSNASAVPSLACVRHQTREHVRGENAREMKTSMLLSDRQRDGRTDGRRSCSTDRRHKTMFRRRMRRRQQQRWMRRMEEMQRQRAGRRPMFIQPYPITHPCPVTVISGTRRHTMQFAVTAFSAAADGLRCWRAKRSSNCVNM